MRIGFLVIAVAVSIAPPAPAATKQDLAACRAVTVDDAQIAACTRVIADQAIPANDRALAHFYRGSAYEAKGAYQEALADFNALLRIRPIGVVYANRGLVYQRLHDFQRSIADFTEALRLDPSLAQAHKWRGVSYFNTGRARARDRRFRARRSSLDPKDTELYWQRGQAHEFTRDLKAAPGRLQRTDRARAGLAARLHHGAPRSAIALGDPSRRHWRRDVAHAHRAGQCLCARGTRRCLPGKKRSQARYRGLQRGDPIDAFVSQTYHAARRRLPPVRRPRPRHRRFQDGDPHASRRIRPTRSPSSRRSGSTCPITTPHEAAKGERHAR